MAKNKSSKSTIENMFPSIETNSTTREAEKIEIPDMKEESSIPLLNADEIRIAQENIMPLPSTQGKKGEKLLRMSLGYTKENYDYITRRSRNLGLTKNGFMHKVIEFYKKFDDDQYQR